MIVNENKSVIERSNLGQEGNFSIKASAKAFSILSSGLYSNKILAIIRELSCNAYDSHVAASKKQIPIQIHLPNTLEPYFAVRDFGTGLSHEDIMTLYTTYFESTKTNSNDYIGALGLGSKSPFSYTDSFTVTSFVDGNKKVYNAFLNEHGVPSIVVLLEEKTEEINGIEVKLSVKVNDYNSFKHETFKFCEYFTPLPVILGIDPKLVETIQKPKYLLEGNGWAIRSNDYYSSSGESRAIQGQVCYTGLRNWNDESTQELRDLKQLLHLPIDLFFKIGEVDVAASREQLSFDKRTINNIGIKLKQVQTEIVDRAVKEITSQKTKYLALARYNELCKMYYLKSFLPKTSTDKKMQFVLHHAGQISLNLEEFKNKRYDLFVKHFGYKSRCRIFSTQHNTQSTINIYPNPIKEIFIVDDLKNGLNKRIKSIFKDGKEFYVLKCENKIGLEKLLRALGNPTYIMASTIEVAEELKTKKAKEHFTYSLTSNKLSSTQVAPDFKVGGLYVIKNKFSVYHKADEHSKFVFSQNEAYYLFQAVNKLALIDSTKVVHAFTDGEFKLLKDKTVWVNLFDHLKQQLKNTVKVKQYDIALQNLEALDYFRQKVDHNQLSVYTSRLQTINTELFKKFRVLYFSISTKETESNLFLDAVDAVKNSCKYLKIPVRDLYTSNDTFLELLEIIRQIESKYPLIKHCYYNIKTETKAEQDAIDYILMVDKLQK